MSLAASADLEEQLGALPGVEEGVYIYIYIYIYTGYVNCICLISYMYDIIHV